MLDMAAPLLEEKYLMKVISDWQRPLPRGYLSQPLVITGPSGVGKGRLIRALLADYAKFIQKVVTHTTRLPRKNEVNGTHYYFVDRELYHSLNGTSDFFVETAVVHDNLYGMSRAAWQQVINKNKISIFEIDVQGAKSIKALEQKLQIKPVYVFVAPPDIESLKNRLIERDSESPKQIETRLQNAVIELEEAQRSGIFQHFLVNTDINNATNALFRLVRDHYVTLPSAAQIRKLQRVARDLKLRILEQQKGSSDASGTDDT
eukprot:gene24728-29880_t